MESEGKRDCSAVANTSSSLVGMLAGKPEKLGRRGTRTNSLKSMHKNARLCRKGQSSLGRSPKAGFPVFSASDEALPTALSLWYPGGMQSYQNVSRLITGNGASAPSKED